jgi:hypothetical protein
MGDEFRPPTVEEVQAYIDELGLQTFTGVRFVEYYAKKGWMQGRHNMKDWRAACRMWETRAKTGHSVKTVSRFDCCCDLCGAIIARGDTFWWRPSPSAKICGVCRAGAMTPEPKHECQVLPFTRH